MTVHPRPQYADLIERNMALAFADLQEHADDPGALTATPAGATVVLIPDDDPELAEFNRQLGLRALAEGEDVYFRHVRTPGLAPA
jgi:hypothetical protein